MNADQTAEMAPLVHEEFNYAQEHLTSNKDLCATFEMVGKSAAWVQVTTTALNVVCPMSPSTGDVLCKIIQKLASAQLRSWEPMKFATWFFVSVIPTEIAKMVDHLFAKLFDINDYSLNVQIEQL